MVILLQFDGIEKILRLVYNLRLVGDGTSPDFYTLTLFLGYIVDEFVGIDDDDHKHNGC